MRQSGRSRVLIPIGMIFTTLYCGAVMCLHAADTSGAAKQALEPVSDDGELLLVRAWDPNSGELVGWMPLHRVAITLQQVSLRALSLDLNDAVTIKLLGTSRGVRRIDDVSVAPEATTFQGQKWLPVEREPNLVRVKKCLFYVKSIVFGESKWRLPSKPREEK